MEINFLGDSITEGAGASKKEFCYVETVGKILNCKVNNYGVSGTRIARQTVPSAEKAYDYDFNARVLTMVDADFVFVFGGTNDYGHGDALLGDINDESVYTFYGALNTLVTNLLKKYDKEKICFILPLNRFNQDSIYGEGNKKTALYPLRDYIDCEKNIIKKYEINYLDLRSLFPQPKTNTGDELTVDGLHPNDKGHEIIAKEICKYALSKDI